MRRPILSLVISTLVALAARAQEIAPTEDRVASAKRLVVEAETLEQEGEQTRARETLRRAFELATASAGALERADVIDVLWELGYVARTTGELELALAAWEAVLEFRERTLPADDDDLLMARQNHAAVLLQTGDAARAAELLAQVVAAMELAGADDDVTLQKARMNLALAWKDLGRFAEARALYETIIATFERTLPPEHVYLQAARLNYGLVLDKLGLLEEAIDVEERVIDVLQRTVPDEHAYLQMARFNLGGMLARAGDLPRARALLESAVEFKARTLPEDHPELQRARANLALVLADQGDLAASRVLLEQALAAFERTLPPDHADVLKARANLASSLKQSGDLAAARALEETALAGFEATLAPDHGDVQRARVNLAITRLGLGEVAGARELFARAIEVWGESLAPEHPELLAAKGNLAKTYEVDGRYDEARALLAEVVAAYARSLPDDQPDVQRALANLAELDARRGDWQAANAGLARLLAAQLGFITSFELAASREAAAAAYALRPRMATALTMAAHPSCDAALRRRAFELVETVRAIALTSSGGSTASETEDVRALRARALDLRAQIDASTDGDAERLAAAVLARDRAEAELRRALVEGGRAVPEIRATALARSLPEGAAAIGFWKYAPDALDAPPAASEAEVEHLIAHLLLPSGELRRVELGPASAVETAVAEWRAAIGESAGRGGRLVGAAAPDAAAGRAAGIALRKLVLDPVLAASAGARTLLVCLDDLLALVPLDALPADDGQLVGDSLAILPQVSFARRLAPRPSSSGEPSLVAFGGIDFDAFEKPRALDGDSNADQARARAGRAYAELPATLDEVRGVAELFERRFERPPELFVGARATAASWSEAAARARYLHVATHGYFAGEALRSWADAPLDGERALAGLAPMSLCGLAFAGANGPRDATGRAPGIVTAEQLAGLDLSRCELAVLSACDTQVGLRRASQSLQSLQAALHCAGVRATITSLWKVDDSRTRELMLELYRRAWIDGQPIARALWDAKRELRARGAPLCDWAAWVICGQDE